MAFNEMQIDFPSVFITMLLLNKSLISLKDEGTQKMS